VKANWLTYAINSSLIFGLLFFLGSSSQGKHVVSHQNNHSCAHAWGFFGHKRINRMAVFTLPPEMLGFYKYHIEYITEHAVDPDKRRYAVDGEAPRHYIDIDHYAVGDISPFDLVPRPWFKAVEKYTEDTLQAYGIVPWYLDVMVNKLTHAFKTKNVDLILKYSADLGHYVGDAHVPLHTTKNYNGQLSNQYGIHGLWESRLPELFAENYDYFVGKASYVKNVIDYAWDVVYASHMCVDSVLRIEKELTAEMPEDAKYVYETRGATTMRNYSKEFSKLYHLRLNQMVERRLKASILGVGSMWYTAWVNAGQPDLNALINTKPTAELDKEKEELEEKYSKRKAKGRVCEHDH
jgi:hypothetical protein